MELSFKRNFQIEEEQDQVAVKGTLKCDCGCEKFTIFHTGKQTKGIFASNVVKDQKQIFIEGVCSKCGKKILLYDSSVDGEKPIQSTHPEKKQFLHKDCSEFEVEILLNYHQGAYLSNQFLTIYIYLKDDQGNELRFYEE